FAGLIVSVGMLAGCATPAEQTPTTTPSSTTTTMTTTTTPEPEPEPEPDPAQIRQQVASMLMPGAVSYDDAKAKLEAGVGGIFITSWADPNLLTEPAAISTPCVLKSGALLMWPLISKAAGCNAFLISSAITQPRGI